MSAAPAPEAAPSADGAVDVGPPAARGVRAPFVPTRRLALFTLLLAPLWLASAQPAGLLVAAAGTALLVVAVILDALLAPGVDDVAVARRAPAVLGLGERGAGAYVVRTSWPRAARVEVHDVLPDALERRWGAAAPGDDVGGGGEGGEDASVDAGGEAAGGAGTAEGAETLGAATESALRGAGGAPPRSHDRAAGDREHHPSAAHAIGATPIVDAPPSVLRGARAWRVPPGGECEIPFTLLARARGDFALGPVAVRVVGPAGLVARTVRYRPSDRIAVAPSVAGVRRYRLLALQHRLRDAGVRAVRRRGSGTTFAALREYAVGDDPRHVDWKATARRGAMVTREFTVEQGQTVIIAIDAGRLMTQFAGPLPRFEYALSAALVLADVAAASGDEVGALVFDDEVRAHVPPARGRRALRGLREALVPVQASMAEPDYAAAFRTLATRHRKRALLVLFTDVIDARASQALIAHTARGAARHLPLVVALRNDALLAAAAPGATTTGALYAAAAAEELLVARAEALARMRQAGVAVVDVSPHAMAAAVVNRYLEVKGRGAL